MMKTAKLSPSMMCADICYSQETLELFRENGVEYLHVDVMDGSFVPNFTLGVDYCRQLHRNSDIPLDIHLMVERPEEKLEWFDLREGDMVAVHYEAARHLQRALALIHAKGSKTLVALNPGTPIEVLGEVLDDLDGVLVMSVNPGFAGQKMVPAALDKIRRLRTWLDEKGCGHVFIEVDGNVSLENATKMRRAGADTFVGGTAAIFKEGRVTKERLNSLRQAIQNGEER